MNPTVPPNPPMPPPPNPVQNEDLDAANMLLELALAAVAGLQIKIINQSNQRRLLLCQSRISKIKNVEESRNRFEELPLPQPVPHVAPQPRPVD